MFDQTNFQILFFGLKFSLFKKKKVTNIIVKLRKEFWNP